MLPSSIKNPVRRSLLLEINPYQTLVAGIARDGKGPARIEYAAEFDADDVAGPRKWIEERSEGRKNWLQALCGFVPRYGILQRETLTAAELEDPAHLTDLIRDQHTRRGASTAPFLNAKIEDWTFRAVHAVGGAQPSSNGDAAPMLVAGLQTREIQLLQQQLLDYRLLPQRIEPALLPLFGSLYQIMAARRQSRAVVVFVIRSKSTAIYILGKEGVHTPGIVGQGLLSVVQQTRKEFNLESESRARARLVNSDAVTRGYARKLVRGLADDLRPVLDSYEMTTGHPVGAIYCAYLPPSLAWLSEPLARAIGHEPLAVDCQEWMQMAGLQPAPRLPAFGPHWLGALSLAANLPADAGGKGDKAYGDTASFQRPWHVDSRNTVELPEQRATRRRAIAAVAGGALLLVALLVTAWQGYAASSLRGDAAHWERELAQNRDVFVELTAAAAEVRTRAGKLREAHGLMRTPYQSSEFLMNLGRTLPPRMRIDRIDGNPSRVLVGGTLFEPAEEASLTLGRYLDTLRNSPEIGTLFPSITASSLQREGSADALTFEITLRLPAQP